jgi:hypothetical protein
MSAKCFWYEHVSYNGHSISPERCRLIAAGKDKSRDEVHRKSVMFGLMQKVTFRERYNYGVMDALNDLGSVISLMRPTYGLYVVGDRNSILAMFQKADNLEIYVKNPPGVFVGAAWDKQGSSKDTLMVVIASGQLAGDVHDNKQYGSNVRMKNGNCYLSDKSGKARSLGWNWTNISKELGITAKGEPTLHARAFELPLKNIFDQNKWW